LLNNLLTTENELHTVLLNHPHDAQEIIAALPAFIELAGMAQQILLDSQDLITRGVEQMQDESESVKRTLVVQAVALVPAAFILAGIFAVLISRPVRQIDQAIRQLGDGEFDESAVITGPRGAGQDALFAAHVT
jgi:two-component system sensor histidine kinase GlrK